MAQTQVKKKKRRNVNNMAYLYVLPFVVVFLVFSVYPVVRTFQFSFSSYKGYGDVNFIGFDQYIRVFKDKYFWRALWNTVRIWSVNIILQLGLAFLLTIVFADIKYKIRGLGFWRAVYYLPNIIAVTSVGFLFSTLLDWRFGSVNQIILGIAKTFGGTYNPINWMGDKAYTGWVIAVISAWMWFGNSFIMLMAGVQGISKDYYEAAAIDGANRWVVFGKITIPLLRPILIYVAITSLIGGLQMFDMPFIMTGNTDGNPSGTTQTVIMYMYKFGFEAFQVGYAAAIAYVLFIIILIVSLIQFKIMNKED